MESTEKDILSTSHTTRLYNTQAFTVATILGGPLAAAYLASRNFKTFGAA